jgi:hypothetical protein
MDVSNQWEGDMQPMIAFCGLDCAQCEGYLATQADDEAWKERVAAQWRENYNAPDLTAKSVTCDGCKATSGRLGSNCFVCEVRLCGLQKGVENCAACPDYACEKLEAFFQFAPAIRTTLDELRKGYQA